jgi:hypothetical protein
LNNSIPVDHADAEVAALRKNLSTFATVMLSGNPLAFYFTTAPQGGHLHVIVQPPGCKSSGWSLPLTELLIPFSMQYHRRAKSTIYLTMMPTATKRKKNAALIQ